MNHCRDENNKPICLECASKWRDLTNAVNASDRAIKCSLCGKEIPSVRSSVGHLFKEWRNE
jgi:predicted amidophosphoribosyltransferase